MIKTIGFRKAQIAFDERQALFPSGEMIVADHGIPIYE
jgi:hypothetical protein